LKRDFYALSGLFYVADKHFEMFYSSRKKSIKRMNELFDTAPIEERAEQEINLDSLKAYLQNKFVDRGVSDPKTISSLVTDLTEAGYKDIGEVDRIIDMAQDAFQCYENNHPPVGGKYSPVGVVDASVGLINKDYIRITLKNFYKEKGKPINESIVKGYDENYEECRGLIKRQL